MGSDTPPNADHLKQQKALFIDATYMCEMDGTSMQ